MSHVPRSLFPDEDDYTLARKIVYKMGTNRHDSENPATIAKIDNDIATPIANQRLPRILTDLIDSQGTPVEGEVDRDHIYLDSSYWEDPIYVF
jgi:hypothetical protein